MKVTDYKTNLTIICGALRDLVPCTKFKKREKNTHGGVLLLVKLQDESSMGVFHVL